MQAQFLPVKNLIPVANALTGDISDYPLQDTYTHQKFLCPTINQVWRSCLLHSALSLHNQTQERPGPPVMTSSSDKN